MPQPPDAFRVIAHRGASAYAPENTLPAFERALALGAREVELDVRLSRDDRVVVFHDDTLADKTGVAGRVRDHDAAFLRSLDVGAWFDRTHPGAGRRFEGTPPALLDEVFEAFGDRLFYHVELKSGDPDLRARVAHLLERHGLRERVMITSFERAWLERMREAEPGLPLGWLLGRGARRHDERIDEAAAAGFRLVGIAAAELTPELVRHAHARGLEIRAWKVRGDRDLERVLDVGADGLTTNWPDRALAELERRRAAELTEASRSRRR